MNLDTQFKLKKEPLYTNYLREHSNWYKLLNRDPKNFSLFEEQVKIDYKLRPTDRLNKALEYMDMIEAIMSTLK